ncbi:MAG: 30S ribosomal protein S4 [Acidobacteriia bacterium]|nr:30S ribosomal protein S4 [Terriglobia bacterium]MYC66664.1 30S ribosomal protein S4 [Terriglobia bacterium]
MARNRGPVVRRSRRLGMALDPKSERLLDKRPYAPGQHGKTQRPRKMLGYALQMQEKQRARFMYDVLERQFRRYYERAARQPGVVGDNLLTMLERRLDNVVFRMGFAVSRRQARQIVNHGHVRVNGGKVDIPSYQVADGDVVEIRERSREHGGIRLALEAPVSASPPAWLERGSDELRGRVLAAPSKEDLENTQINAQLIVELYSR